MIIRFLGFSPIVSRAVDVIKASPMKAGVSPQIKKPIVDN